jgi:hypothetical protein
MEGRFMYMIELRDVNDSLIYRSKGYASHDEALDMFEEHKSDRNYPDLRTIVLYEQVFHLYFPSIMIKEYVLKTYAV